MGTKDEMIEDLIDEAESSPQMLFHDMIFEDFDGGYLVQCYEDHPYYQSQTYHGGVWNEQADGWFFLVQTVVSLGIMDVSIMITQILSSRA